MKEIEIEGKTVTHAVERGLADLGLRRDQVEVEVLQEASPGFLGLGAKLAKVRIREKIWGDPQPESAAAATTAPRPARPARPPRRPAPEPRSETPPPRRDAPNAASTVSSSGTSGTPSQPSPSTRPAYARDARTAPRERSAYAPAPRNRSGESPFGRGSRPYPSSRAGESGSRPSPVHQAPPDVDKACAEAKVVVEEILKLLKLEQTKISAAWDAKQVRVQVSVEGPGTEEFLAKGGNTLGSLQFIVTLILSRRLKTPVAVQVDCGGYWQEQEEAVLLQVHQAMEMVQRTRRPVRLQPMDSCMRRLIHRTLANHPEFETVSEGEGSWRKVVIKPKRK